MPRCIMRRRKGTRIDTNITKYILCNMKTTTSVKLDKDIKNRASALANELGLSLSVVINATLKKFVDERRVVLSVAPEFNEKTKKEFLQIKNDIKKGKNLSKIYNNADDLFKALKI